MTELWPIARLPSSGGCVSERRRREYRGAGRRRGEWVGAGEGAPLPLKSGFGEGAVPPSQKIFKIKMTCFGALWSMDFNILRAYNVPAREGS